MTRAPIFVCGLSRSGTGWLAKSLGQSPELVYLREAWLIERLQGLVDWHGTLHDEWQRFTPWREQGIDRAAFVAETARFYGRLLARAAGGRRFVEKTPEGNALHLPLLREMFPDAYFLLIHRDGRNYVASRERKVASQGEAFDFDEACRRWARTMAGFAHAVGDGAASHLRLVRYEDLLRSFDSQLREICRFVRVAPFAPEPLAPNTSFPERDGGFEERWKTWDEARRRRFRELAGAELVRWGYVESDEAW